jgi:hypothetical protein
MENQPEKKNNTEASACPRIGHALLLAFVEAEAKRWATLERQSYYQDGSRVHPRPISFEEEAFYTRTRVIMERLYRSMCTESFDVEVLTGIFDILTATLYHYASNEQWKRQVQVPVSLLPGGK